MRIIGVLLALTVALSAQEPKPELAIRIVVPEADTYVSGVTTLKAEILPKMLATRVAQILFFADGKQVCNVLDPIAAECTWDAGAEVRRAHLPRGRQPDRRRPHRGELADQGPRPGGEGERRGRADHDGGHRARAVCRRPAAGVVPSHRRRRAANHRSLLRRRIAARDRRGHRRQREHDAGDAAAEKRGEEIPGGARAQGPGDGGGVQRSHVHADQARDQRGAAHARHRSADGVGRHRVV